jgi:hypothetical protein
MASLIINQSPYPLIMSTKACIGSLINHMAYNNELQSHHRASYEMRLNFPRGIVEINATARAILWRMEKTLAID